jgi:preprotein translocase subunit YajC
VASRRDRPVLERSAPGHAATPTLPPYNPPVLRPAVGRPARFHSFSAGKPMFFIANAYAQTAPAAQPGAESSLMSIGFMVLIFIVFYFLLIRPQVKRQKEHKSMVEALNKGDEVVTAGGIVGKITDIADQYITLQVAAVDGQPVQISMQRAAVQTLLPKGTVKSL